MATRSSTWGVSIVVQACGGLPGEAVTRCGIGRIAGSGDRRHSPSRKVRLHPVWSDRPGRGAERRFMAGTGFSRKSPSADFGRQGQRSEGRLSGRPLNSRGRPEAAEGRQGLTAHFLNLRRHSKPRHRTSIAIAIVAVLPRRRANSHRARPPHEFQRRHHQLRGANAPRLHQLQHQRSAASQRTRLWANTGRAMSRHSRSSPSQPSASYRTAACRSKP